MIHGTETLDHGIVKMSNNPKGISTFLTFRRRSAAQNVQNVKDSFKIIDIRDMAQEHWIMDLSQCKVILVEY